MSRGTEVSQSTCAQLHNDAVLQSVFCCFLRPVHFPRDDTPFLWGAARQGSYKSFWRICSRFLYRCLKSGSRISRTVWFRGRRKWTWQALKLSSKSTQLVLVWRSGQLWPLRIGFTRLSLATGHVCPTRWARVDYWLGKVLEYFSSLLLWCWSNWGNKLLVCIHCSTRVAGTLCLAWCRTRFALPDVQPMAVIIHM